MENIKELSKIELTEIHGGGLLYDAYRIIKAEGQDFWNGLKKGFTEGINGY